ncbi:MAG: metallophosphoesterase family protein, partial [Fulvivirga sp.]|nr:metallophosphoesterase family protein [Fulvivirga sp.]
MKLLLFSDVHCNKSHCKRLVAQANSVDMVVGAGDFGAMRRGIAKTIQYLKPINRPTVLVPGNAESYEELIAACSDWQQAHVLHGSGVKLLDTAFFGIGGGIPVTPF